jgi:hypothetical protein
MENNPFLSRFSARLLAPLAVAALVLSMAGPAHAFGVRLSGVGGFGGGVHDGRRHDFRNIFVTLQNRPHSRGALAFKRALIARWDREAVVAKSHTPKSTQPIPEPSSVVLLLAGMTVVGIAARKRQRAA